MMYTVEKVNFMFLSEYRTVEVTSPYLSVTELSKKYLVETSRWIQVILDSLCCKKIEVGIKKLDLSLFSYCKLNPVYLNWINFIRG